MAEPHYDAEAGKDYRPARDRSIGAQLNFPSKSSSA
jgi:hypothetical protein